MNGERVLAVAKEEIGYREGSSKENKYGRWFGHNNDAWCMIFVQWVYHIAGLDLPYKTASCGALLRWYRANQPDCVRTEPVPGCIVIFDFPDTRYDTDHTGLFVCKTASKITSIDGNTSNGSEGNGGWVQQRTRSLLYANPTYIVPRGLEDEIVKRYDSLSEISNGAPWATETVAKLIDKKYLGGRGKMRDAQGRPADLDLSEDMLRLLVINDRAGIYN